MKMLNPKGPNIAYIYKIAHFPNCLLMVECEGDMGLILESVMCSREEDEERFRAIIDQAIKDKEVKTFKVKR